MERRQNERRITQKLVEIDRRDCKRRTGFERREEIQEVSIDNRASKRFEPASYIN